MKTPESTVPADELPSDPAGLPPAHAPDTVDLGDGDRLRLRIAPVAKRVGDATVRMLAYNGSVPGPTLRVRQGSSVVIEAVNDGDLETTVHWHGLRLDNRYDGTHLTQRPMPVGGSFTYRLDFPDPGAYWYHPHVREDYGQELGLYGVIVVEPSDPDYWPPADREIAITLDDLLIEEGRIAPFRRSTSNYTAMGRFGNVMLANGEPKLALAARAGEVVRFYFTATSNTRVFDVGVPGARMKRVGGDSGRCEREEMVESVIVAPSERVVVDVLFDESGRFALEHRTPQRSYELGVIDVEGGRQPSRAHAFARLRTSPDLTAERQRIASYLTAEPDKVLALVATMDMGEPELPAGASIVYACPMHPEVVRDEPGRCPRCRMKLLAVEAPALYACPMHPEVTSGAADRCPKCGMKLVPARLVSGAGQEKDHGSHDDGGQGHGQGGPHAEAPTSGASGGHAHGTSGIEWEDDMVEVNRMTTPSNTRWKLIDRATGAEGMGVDWRFRVGDRVKIRLVNEMESDHPMHHPFHIHGAGRFLVLSRDGVVESNLVWKDTVLVTTGQTVDLLLEVTNPGVWMAHCHIAEHHESGMMLSFTVDP